MDRADPDPNFYVDADPDPDPDPDWHQNYVDPHVDPTPNFTHVGKSEYFLYLYSQHCQFTTFIFSSV